MLRLRFLTLFLYYFRGCIYISKSKFILFTVTHSFTLKERIHKMFAALTLTSTLPQTKVCMGRYSYASAKPARELQCPATISTVIKI